jgi:ssDNA-binding replication factor A large subunit
MKEEIIQRILTQCRTLTRHEVEKAIEDRKASSGGLLTDGAATRLVAAEYGVEVKVRKVAPKIYIEQLVSGLTNVTVTGKVLTVGETKQFSTVKRQGQVVRLTIADRTGRIAVVLWNERAETAKMVQLGQIVRVKHGYVRRSKYGPIELNVAERGDLQVSPSDVVETDFPQMKNSEHFPFRIIDLKEGSDVHVLEGMIKTQPTLKEVTTKSGEKVPVTSFELEDSTGKIRVSAWRKHAEKIAELNAGSKVVLKNTYVKRGLRNQLEITTRASTEIVACQ